MSSQVLALLFRLEERGFQVHLHLLPQQRQVRELALHAHRAGAQALDAVRVVGIEQEPQVTARQLRVVEQLARGQRAVARLGIQIKFAFIHHIHH